MHRKTRKLLILCSFLCQQQICLAQDAYNYVFKNGLEGYACYRIPAIIKAPNGNFLAFAEARKKDCNDFGDIDLVMKKSSDDGRSWGPLEVIVDNQLQKSGDPAPVVDFLDPAYPGGRIFLLYINGSASENDVLNQRGVREVLYVTSIDNGKSWADPVNITLQVHRPNLPAVNPAFSFADDWRTVANTPGHGMQFTKGKYRGRIYIAANHSAGPRPGNSYDNYRAHGYYSDDHGKTWNITPNVSIPGGNESTAAELSDGSLLQNIRHQNKQGKYRILAKSSSAGNVWDTSYISHELPEPVCEGSMISVVYRKKFYVLFSNPKDQNARKNMTITVSDDDGASWRHAMLVDAGAAAYSDLVQMKKGNIGILYERGNTGGIVFKKYTMKEILKSTNKQ
ncbi:MAG: sialidase family protein [Chitinophagaceae bacterium]